MKHELRGTQVAKLLSILLCLMLVLSLAQVGSAYALSTFAMQLGGPGTDDMFRGIEKMEDGYIVVGTTNSFGAGGNDAWVIKLNENGKVESQRTVGGKGGDVGRSVKTTEDGGFVIGGITYSFSNGGADFWVVKFDSNEALQWSKSYGGSNNDMAHAIEVTSDGGYLVGGFTTSFGAVGKDYFVLKLDSNGNQQWAKRFGGAYDDVIRIVKETSDGKFLVAGFTHSFGKNGDIMVIKLSSAGNIEWQKSYGGGGFEEPSSILETPDGYIILEQSNSFSKNSDGWVFKIDTGGNMIWQKLYGGGSFDELSSARLTDDGGFIVAGETKSFNAVNEDFWVVKFSASGQIEWQKRYGGPGVDEAEDITLTPEGGSITVGTTKSFGAAGEDVWVIRADSSGGVSQCAPDVNNLATTANTFTTSANPANTGVTQGSHTVLVKVGSPQVKVSNANIVYQCDSTKINRPPVATDDRYSAAEDTPLQVPAPGVLSNDTDADGDQLTAVKVSAPANGVLVLAQNGSFVYTPNNDFFGTDTFTYKADDGTDESNTATVTIAVGGINDPPTAGDDTYSTQEDTPLQVPAPGVLSNDTDVEGDSLTADKITNPSNGDLTFVQDGSFSYTPDPNFEGTDTFTYRANDGTDQSSIATVTIKVGAVNDPPVAHDQAVVTDEDTPVLITLTGTDPDDSLTYTVQSQPTFGTLSGTVPALTYTPNPNYNGQDSFTFKVNDGTQDSNVATVSITVNSVNDNPEAVDDSAIATGVVPIDIPVLANDSDIDGDTLEVSVGPTSDQGGILLVNADGSIKYAAPPGFDGIDTFTYTVSDGNGGTDTATVTVTVTAAPPEPP